MGETKLSNKAGQLFDYLNDVVKLGYKPTYRLEDHNHFLLYQDQLPKVELIDNNEQFYFLDSNLFTIIRKEVPEPPEKPNLLGNWIDVSDDPEDMINIELWENRLKSGIRENFYEIPERELALRTYIKQWNLELEPLIDAGITETEEIRSQFRNLSYESKEENPYLDLFYEASGLSAEGAVAKIENAKLKPSSQLKVVDGWALFVRKRNQNELLKDIREFNRQLEEEEVELPGGLDGVLVQGPPGTAKKQT